MWGIRRSVTVGAMVAIAGGILMPAPAFAASGGEARVIDEGVHYTAANGDVNNVVVTRSGRTVTIDDRLAIRPGRGCAAVRGDRTKVRCTTAANPEWLVIDLGDKNDRLVNKVGVGITTSVQGGAGNDTLTGGAGNDVLDGDAGNDVISGGAGPDGLIGGTGDDVLRGDTGDDMLNADAGADTMSGGSGIDSVYYGVRKKAVTVDLDGAKRDDGEPGEKDTVGADVEGILGGSGDDRLTGNGAANLIVGGPGGNDVIRGGGGNDTLVGQSGHDSIHGDAGDDYLVGEFQRSTVPNPDGEDRDDPAARDRLYGGASTSSRGDICVGGPAARLNGCEYTR